MNTATLADARFGVGTGDVTLPRVIRSEWTKLRSLRSTVWTLGIAVVLTIGMAVLLSVQASRHWSVAEVHDGRADPVFQTLGSLLLVQVPIGVLGVLTMTGEYATGMIRATFGLVPRRLPVLWAKIIVFAGVIFTLTLASSALAFFIGQGILSGKGLSVGLGSPGAARAILGAALYLTLIGLLGLGLGALLRHTAGAVTALLGLVLALPFVMELLGQSFHHAERYTPTLTGEALASTSPTSVTDLLSPQRALVTIVCWVLVGLAAGTVATIRRDV
jgi:ABC-2 type transport system permease protein